MRWLPNWLRSHSTLQPELSYTLSQVIELLADYHVPTSLVTQAFGDEVTETMIDGWLRGKLDGYEPSRHYDALMCLVEFATAAAELTGNLDTAWAFQVRDSLSGWTVADYIRARNWHQVSSHIGMLRGRIGPYRESVLSRPTA